MTLSLKKNKWLKYKYMENSEQLAPYMPKTELMTRSSFWKLIARYGRVIVKPVDGSRGRGVIQISAMRKKRYEIHAEKSVIKQKGKERTYYTLRRRIGSQAYMVQRRISRAKIKGCPYDMRVIVQRKKGSSTWKVTGKIAKLAGRGYIVSNITRSKGTLLPVRTAIGRSSLKRLSQRTLKSKLYRIAILSAKRLSNLFPHHRIYGLDMALDKKGHAWIIEANLFPSMSHFRKLKDKKMYHRIMRYKRRYRQ
jgi:hypothetical protein